jgi:hypothetical protein
MKRGSPYMMTKYDDEPRVIEGNLQSYGANWRYCCRSSGPPWGGRGGTMHCCTCGGECEYCRRDHMLRGYSGQSPLRCQDAAPQMAETRARCVPAGQAGNNAPVQHLSRFRGFARTEPVLGADIVCDRFGKTTRASDLLAMNQYQKYSEHCNRDCSRGRAEISIGCEGMHGPALPTTAMRRSLV